MAKSLNVRKNNFVFMSTSESGSRKTFIRVFPPVSFPPETHLIFHKAYWYEQSLAAAETRLSLKAGADHLGMWCGIPSMTLYRLSGKHKNLRFTAQTPSVRLWLTNLLLSREDNNRSPGAQICPENTEKRSKAGKSWCQSVPGGFILNDSIKYALKFRSWTSHTYKRLIINQMNPVHQITVFIFHSLTCKPLMIACSRSFDVCFIMWSCFHSDFILLLCNLYIFKSIQINYFTRWHSIWKWHAIK